MLGKHPPHSGTCGRIQPTGVTGRRIPLSFGGISVCLPNKLPHQPAHKRCIGGNVGATQGPHGIAGRWCSHVRKCLEIIRRVHNHRRSLCFAVLNPEEVRGRGCLNWAKTGLHQAFHRPQYGPVAVSALGSGCTCPPTVIAFCPSCQCTPLPLSVQRAGARPLTLPPLATLVLRAL